jgi:hypothetical protein
MKKVIPQNQTQLNNDSSNQIRKRPNSSNPNQRKDNFIPSNSKKPQNIYSQYDPDQVLETRSKLNNYINNQAVQYPKEEKLIQDRNYFSNQVINDNTYQQYNHNRQLKGRDENKFPLNEPKQHEIPIRIKNIERVQHAGPVSINKPKTALDNKAQEVKIDFYNLDLFSPPNNIPINYDNSKYDNQVRQEIDYQKRKQDLDKFKNYVTSLGGPANQTNQRNKVDQINNRQNAQYNSTGRRDEAQYQSKPNYNDYKEKLNFKYGDEISTTTTILKRNDVQTQEYETEQYKLNPNSKTYLLERMKNMEKNQNIQYSKPLNSGRKNNI